MRISDWSSDVCSSDLLRSGRSHRIRSAKWRIDILYGPRGGIVEVGRQGGPNRCPHGRIAKRADRGKYCGTKPKNSQSKRPGGAGEAATRGTGGPTGTAAARADPYGKPG